MDGKEKEKGDYIRDSGEERLISGREEETGGCKKENEDKEKIRRKEKRRVDGQRKSN